MTRDAACLLTPPGGAAIAVVRLLGPGVAPFLRAHFSRPAIPARCVHGDLYAPTPGTERSDDPDSSPTREPRPTRSIIDDPVVVLSPDGTWADVNTHGGPWVVESVLALAARAGFAVIERGTLPLPPEAIAEADSLIEAEMLAHVPLAQTELALETLTAQPAAWAALDANGDDAARAAALADPSLWWLLHPPRVAIAGAPNVGKSTLANQLFATRRSITADAPGTTRDWVGEIADVDGLAVMLLDTPGIRDTADPIEAAAIDRSAPELAAADLVLLVLDAAAPVGGDEANLIARFPAALRVTNKMDLAGGAPAPLGTVATTGRGVDAVRAAIRAHFRINGRHPAAARWWTARQRAQLDARVAAR